MGKKGPDRRKRPGPVQDWDLWTRVGRSVDPMARRKTADPKALLEKALNAPTAADGNAISSFSSKSRPFAHPPMPSAGPLVAASSPASRRSGTIEPGLKRRLERGALPIDATLDLHGMNQNEAFESLKRFVPARAARGDRTLLVITGKGLKKTGYLQIEQKGILRAMLPRWLADPALRPLVSGLDQAHQTHGGEGAFYIRLKRART